jgi:hypothetical protein
MPEPRINAIRWSDWVVPNGGIDESKSDHELDAKRWASGLDVEPLPTGCRARNGKTKINTVAARAIVISNQTGTDAREFSNGTENYMAQGITGTAATAAGRLSAIAVRIAKKTGTPTVAVDCAIYTNSAGQPGTAVSGLGFANFNSVAAATINAAGTLYQWIFFVPTTDTVLADGTIYHIVLRSTGGGAGNNYQLQESTAGNPYTGTGNTVNFGSDGIAWTSVALADLWFRVYVGGTAIQGILDYNLSDAATERLLIAAGGEVYKETSGVLAAVSGLDASIMSSGADVHPAMNVGDDKAFISNGVDTPKKFFIRSATEYWANDGISPPIAPNATPSVVAGGTLPIDTYFIDYWYYDSVLGTKSNTRFQGADTISATTAGANQTIRLTGLPAAVARVGDRATHIRVSLRPTLGGLLYRYSGFQVALGTTTLDITASTLGSEPDYDDEVALTHTLAVVGANQRFIAGISAQPWRVMASKLNLVGAFYESFPSLNFRDFGKGDGDYVTALAFIPPATLIVGMRNSVWALDARRFLTGDPVLISKNVGIAGGHAFMVVGRTLFFLSDSDTTKGLMVWDGSQVIPLTGLDKTLKTYNTERFKYASCAHMAPGDTRFQWWILLSESGSTQNRALVYEYALDALTVYRHSANILGSAAVAGAISKIKMGGTNGFLHNADTGTTDDGTAISGTFTGKRFDFGMPDAVKRVRFVRAEGDGVADASLAVQFRPDIQGFPSFSGVLNFDGDPGSLLGTGILGSFILGSANLIISTRVGFTGVCRNAQPMFSGDSRWSLRGYAIGVQSLRRR